MMIRSDSIPFLEIQLQMKQANVYLKLSQAKEEEEANGGKN